MKKKIKAPALPVIQTTEQLEATLASVAALQNSINNAESMMNGRLTEVRTVFEPGITADKQKLKLEIDNIQDYADAHPELFTRKKSVEFVHGTIGYPNSSWAPD
jgi:phage host-nuclease inhibitor protein Gam